MYQTTMASYEEIESTMLDVFETCCRTANMYGIEALTPDEQRLLDCELTFTEFYYMHI